MPWLLRLYLTFLPFLLIASVYLGWRLSNALTALTQWPAVKIRMIVFFVLSYLHLHVFLQLLLYLSGYGEWISVIRAGWLTWDLLFTYPFWVYVIIIAELVPVLLVAELMFLILALVLKQHRKSLTGIHKMLVLAVAFLMTSHALIRVVVDNQRIVVSEEELQVDGLPDGLDGLRIVHITDVQADAFTGAQKLGRYVNTVNQLSPDIVFFTGDLVTSGTEYIDLGAHWMGQIQARLGVYACMGDHDIWASRDMVIEALQERDIPVLENENLWIAVNGDSLMATFVTDTYSDRIQQNQFSALHDDIAPGTFKTLVVHQPTEWLVQSAMESDYSLFLGGHTHGGQIILRPLGITVTAALRDTRYFKGFYWLEDMLVCINSGLGYTIAPVRYRAPAEVSMIVLKQE